MNNNESIGKKKVSTKIDENLPTDLYTKASVALMNALITGKFDEFGSLLGDDARIVCYGYKTLNGKAETLDYLNGWHQRHVVTSKVTDFEVVRCNYYSHACLKMDSMVAMFHIRGTLISTLLFTLIEFKRFAPYYNNMNYPLDFERIKQYLEPLPEIDDEGNTIDTTNRTPCLQCGMESDKLTWYQSTIPTSFSYRNWSRGQVSVCPQCGRVVEYIFVKNIKKSDAETERFKFDALKNGIFTSKHNSNGNVYSAMAEKIYSTKMLKEQTEPFVTHLFAQLTDVQVEPDFKVILKLASQIGLDANSELWVSGPNGDEKLDVKHLRVKQTKMAAWQLYLLSRISTVLPYSWHGGYNMRTFIFSASVIDKIFPLKFQDLSELAAQNLFEPSVEVKEKNGKGCTMLVRCCYWNDWEGLVKEESTIRIEGDRCVSFESERTNLFKYDCGIWF